MSIWSRIGRVLSVATSQAFSAVVESVRYVFEGDPETRRRVAFSIAMIALSAKMAKADGVVTMEEVAAFEELFEVPDAERRNVERLYKLAMQDVAGYQAYAKQLADLFRKEGQSPQALENILDGLFHIAKADGVVHEKELDFLRDVSEVFAFSQADFERLLARHVNRGKADPYVILGVDRDMNFSEIRAVYRKLVAENHPDRLIAQGLPEEFVSIGSERMSAINAAFDIIERSMRENDDV